MYLFNDGYYLAAQILEIRDKVLVIDSPAIVIRYKLKSNQIPVTMEHLVRYSAVPGDWVLIPKFGTTDDLIIVPDLVFKADAEYIAELNTSYTRATATEIGTLASNIAKLTLRKIPIPSIADSILQTKFTATPASMTLDYGSFALLACTKRRIVSYSKGTVVLNCGAVLNTSNRTFNRGYVGIFENQVIKLVGYRNVPFKLFGGLERYDIVDMNDHEYILHNGLRVPKPKDVVPGITCVVGNRQVGYKYMEG